MERLRLSTDWESDASMDPHPDGEYVRADVAEALLEALEAVVTNDGSQGRVGPLHALAQSKNPAKAGEAQRLIARARAALAKAKGGGDCMERPTPMESSPVHSFDPTPPPGCIENLTILPGDVDVNERGICAAWGRFIPMDHIYSIEAGEDRLVVHRVPPAKAKGQG